MDRKIGYYNYTVILTYVGMLCAFVGILASYEGRFALAMVMLLAAGLTDVFDGAVASTKKDRTESEKAFGVQIDSLCDLISFCILPAVFVYMISGRELYVGILCGVYILAGLIRLAFFNVREEMKKYGKLEVPKDLYLGFPVTTAALAFPTAFLIWYFGLITSPIIFVVALVLVAIGFLAPVFLHHPRGVKMAVLVIWGVAESVVLFVLLAKGVL